MGYTLIIILIIVTIAYRRGSASSRPGDSFIRKYWKLLVLFALTIVPVVVLNMIRPYTYLDTPEEILEDALEYGSGKDIAEAYEYNLSLYGDSVTLHLDYIEHASNFRFRGCKDLNPAKFTLNEEIIAIASEYIQFRCGSKELNPDLNIDPYYFDMTATRYINYVRALRAWKFDEWEACERYLKQEILINPEFDKAYEKLYDLYVRHFPNKAEAFLMNDAYAFHLPNDLLNYEYFRMGSYGNYLYTIFVERYLNITFLAFFAGLIISIVWLIYLRSLDVFNKESWRDIIIVFVGGILLTHFCLPLYDTAHYILYMDVTGDFFNDFIYCVVVIGGSEELVKLIPWVLFAIFSRKMKEPYDYLLYASVSAIGFAFAENWMYLEHSQNIVIRFIMSTVGHMFFASIIAYSVMLSKYRIKSLPMKVFAVILGFVLGATAHGFYDFWLISPVTRGLSIVTTIFFIFSIHFWFHLKKNAVSNSKFYNDTPFNTNYQLDLITFSVVGILMLEYVLLSYSYGAVYANSTFSSDAWIVGSFLIYMTYILKKFTLSNGIWHRYKLPKVNFWKLIPTLPDTDNSETSYASTRGLSLRLFAPKTNQYVGQILPQSGRCLESISISGYDDWVIFEFNNPAINLPNVDPSKVILKPKHATKSLNDDKIEVYMLLIPVGISLFQNDLKVEMFKYTGRVYSRPI